jgi:cytidylate kinase
MTGSIESLVDQQIRRWQEERRIVDRQTVVEASIQKPMITISRQFASRGAEIGKLVADELGFHFYSQELIHRVAAEAQVRASLVASLDERAQSGIAHWISSMIQSGRFASSDYLRNLSRVVMTLGRHGQGIIMGRGGQFILEKRLTLRVRIIAPLESRAERVRQRENLTTDQAKTRCVSVDADREAFHRQHFGEDITDPAHYDLVLNTGVLPVRSCVELMVSAFQTRFPADS